MPRALSSVLKRRLELSAHKVDLAEVAQHVGVEGVAGQHFL